nr:MAG: capsid protein [Wufeng shrew picorna-like virus 31]
MHYGKLLVSWRPAASMCTLFDINRRNIPGYSADPNFIISAGQGEVAEMVMPYTLPMHYLDLTDSIYQNMIGEFTVHVLNPLGPTAASPISISVMANFENVEVTGYTRRQTYPVITNRPKYNITSLTGYTIGNNNSIFSIPTTVREEDEGEMLAQGGEQVTKSMNSIARSSNEGPSNFVLDYTKRLVTKPISTILGSLSSIAMAYGYGKPNTLKVPERQILDFFDMATTTGLETSSLLAIDPDNGVSSGDKFLSTKEEDKMILSMASTPAIIAMHTWTGNTAVNTILMDFYVHPCNVAYKLTGANSAQIYEMLNTPLSWVASSCSYWRGSINYHFQMTCSSFHSGRLRITWEPDTGPAVVAAGAGVETRAISHIWDVRKEAVFNFSVPYVRVYPWATTMFPSNQGETPGVGFIDYQSNGRIIVEVINSLSYFSAPVPDVYINVWHSAGNDFQIAAPGGSMMSNYIDSNAPTMVAQMDGGEPPVPPQPKSGAFNLVNHDDSTYLSRFANSLWTNIGLADHPPRMAPNSYRQDKATKDSKQDDYNYSLKGGIKNHPLTIKDYGDVSDRVPSNNRRKERESVTIKESEHEILAQEGKVPGCGRNARPISFFPGNKHSASAPFEEPGAHEPRSRYPDERKYDPRKDHIPSFPQPDRWYDFMNPNINEERIRYQEYIKYMTMPVRRRHYRIMNEEMVAQYGGTDLSMKEGPIDSSHTHSKLLVGQEEGSYVALSRDSIKQMIYPPLIPATTFEDHGICMGEDIVSVMQLMRRPQQIFGISSNGEISGTVSPFSKRRTGDQNKPTLHKYISTTAQTLFFAGLLNHFLMMFRYMRGSFVYKIITDGPTIGAFQLRINMRNNNGFHVDVPTLNYRKLKGMLSTPANAMKYSPNTSLLPLGVVVPYYSNAEAHLIWGSQDAPGLNPNKLLLDFYTGPNITGMGLYENVGDDFNCGFLMGPPKTQYLLKTLIGVVGDPTNMNS